MKHLYLPILVLLFCSCTTLNVSTINSLEKTQFESSVLQPDYDVYDMRIDVIRQTTEEKVDENTINNTKNI